MSDVAEDRVLLDSTVRDIAALVDRTKKSLYEAGETKLAEHCHALVFADGVVRLCFTEVVIGRDDAPGAIGKALSIDPEFEHAGKAE